MSCGSLQFKQTYRYMDQNDIDRLNEMYDLIGLHILSIKNILIEYEEDMVIFNRNYEDYTVQFKLEVDDIDLDLDFEEDKDEEE